MASPSKVGAEDGYGLAGDPSDVGFPKGGSSFLFTS
jgi:hypothetical protein